MNYDVENEIHTNLAKLKKSLNSLVKEIQKKSKHILPLGIFKNNIFRRKSKKLSFERKKLSNPYLFYAIDKRGPSFDIILENLIHNKLNNKLNCLKLPQRWSVLDIETFKGNLYICVLYDLYNDNPVEAKLQLWFTNLSNINQLKIKEIGNMIPRIFLSMVASPQCLFILGGQNNESITSVCEMFNGSDKLKRICDLNNRGLAITGIYIYPDFLYVISGERKERERLNLTKLQKWEKINVKKSYCRIFGACIQICEEEILIFGGQQSNDLFTKFNLANQIYLKVDIQAPDDSFYCSRPRIYNRKIYISSTKIGSDVEKENMRKIEISIDTLQFNVSKIEKYTNEDE